MQDVLPFPRVVRIEPSSLCNLACRHCPTGTVNMPRGLMTERTFGKALDAVYDNRDSVKVVVLYHGGEPLLNHALYDMVSRIKAVDNQLFVKTVTNGMALTRSAAERLIRCGLDAIEISLDGETPEENQLVRRRSDTKRVVSNVHRLIQMIGLSDHDRTPDVYISTTQFVRATCLASGLPAAEPPAWLLREFREGVKEFKTTYAKRWPHMGPTADFREIVGTASKGRRLCDHVISTVTIRADGNVVPCCYDLTSQLVMGNIHDDPLERIWNGANYRALRRSIRGRKYKSVCATCAVVRPARYLIPTWRADQGHGAGKMVKKPLDGDRAVG